MPSLRPVSGSAEEILALLREWDRADDPEPLVIETSGSTGRPKRVVLSRAAMRASAQATEDRLGGPGQWVLNLPPVHVAGVQVLFRSVRAGTEPVLTSDVVAARDQLEGRSYVSLVPTQLHRMLGDPEVVAALTGFDAVLVGGAAVSAELRTSAADHGVRVVATYGMSETCGGCVYDGRPLDGVEVRIDEGRVLLRGPVLFDGYQGEPERTAESLREGWFVTGDLGELGPDGRLRVLGRADDVVLSGGLNVPALAVAQRLREHPAVEWAEVLGVPDEEWGQRVVAFVVGDLDLPGARDWVAAVHPRAWAPRQLVLLEQLPMLDSGKPDRLRLAELA